MPEKTNPPDQLILDFPAQPEYRFSNFIVSAGSEFALDAARRFCSGDPSAPGSLFIFGGAGLGKTHLLIAIGNHVAASLPGRRALYIDCESFIRETADDAAADADGLIARILGADYFLLDDAEKIAASAPAQEKLHYIYNALAARRRRLAFAANRAPDNLPGVADFLVSRFQWGIVAPLKPIDDRAMAGIVKKLGDDLGLEIPDGVVELLLNRIPRDFHSLRDAVDRINRLSYRQKRRVTSALARQALGLPSSLE